jgi:hypothetical protein
MLTQELLTASVLSAKSYFRTGRYRPHLSHANHESDLIQLFNYECLCRPFRQHI